jgi:hypothetical protein
VARPGRKRGSGLSVGPFPVGAQTMPSKVENTYHVVNLALGGVIVTLAVAVGGILVYENFASIKKSRDEWFGSGVQSRIQAGSIQFEMPKAPNGQDWEQWHRDQQALMQKNLRSIMQNYQNTQRQLDSYQSNDSQNDR